MTQKGLFPFHSGIGYNFCNQTKLFYIERAWMDYLKNIEVNTGHIWIAMKESFSQLLIY
jgi:hypothetical protein